MIKSELGHTTIACYFSLSERETKAVLYADAMAILDAFEENYGLEFVTEIIEDYIKEAQERSAKHE